MPILDLESTLSISELYRDSEQGTNDVDPIAYFQRYALNTSLTLNYGYRTEDKNLLDEIFAVERGISNFRSTSNNWEDYVRLLRLFKSTNRKGGPLEFKERRATYMKKLLDTLKARIEQGTDHPCITGNVLKDPEAKLSAGKRLRCFKLAKADLILP
jgi:phenylacetate 2-hydroxylase